ncbi:hypothetical protein F4703DRAFT_1735627, partial [Phycomyces blakesleeanus]
YLAFAIKLARDSGVIIKNALDSRMAGTGARIEAKYDNPTDLVTETDQAVEQFIGEETMAAGAQTEFTAHPTWIVDPIDGTTNFIHGFPFVAVSIGLTIDRESVLGVVYNPLLDELYSAVKGQGAYLNETVRLPLFQPAPPLVDLGHCLVATEVGSDRTPEVLTAKMETLHALMRKKRSVQDKGSAEAHSIRATGSAALNMCCVAKGVVDVYWEVGCWEWDVAAAIVILREAGGLVLSGHNDRQEQDVGLFGRKFLAIRPAADKPCQLKIAHEMWDIIPAIHAPRPHVPGTELAYKKKKKENNNNNNINLFFTRNLPIKGKKDELIARLEEAMNNEENASNNDDAANESSTETAEESQKEVPTETTEETVVSEISSEIVADIPSIPSPKPVESVKETLTEPEVKNIVEPVAETIAESVAESIAESTVQSDIVKPEEAKEFVETVETLETLETVETVEEVLASPEEPTKVESTQVEVTTSDENVSSKETKSAVEENTAAMEDVKEEVAANAETGLKRKREIEDTRGEEQPSEHKKPKVEDGLPAIYIKGFVRPLIIKHVQELIGKYGTVKRFWMDSIKTHCYVVYESSEEAKKALSSIDSIVFPPETGRKLTVGRMTAEQAEHVIEQEQSAAEKRIRLDWETALQAVLDGVAKPTLSPQTDVNVRRPRTLGFEQITRQLQKAATAPQGSTEVTAESIPERHYTEPAPPVQSLSLEELFRKTDTTPSLYYLPVPEDVAQNRLESMKQM